MSTSQITLADCLAEVNNALNYWYPRKSEAESGGASQAELDARHVRLFQFRDRLQQQLGSARYDEVVAIWNTAIEAATRAVPGGSICDPQAVADAIRKLAKPRITTETFDLAMAMAELRNVAAERDSYKAGREALVTVLATYAAERDKARQSLRAAEQEVAETESVNSDLRTVNARLVADLAAAVQRADTAEAILRAKA